MKTKLLSHATSMAVLALSATAGLSQELTLFQETEPPARGEFSRSSRSASTTQAPSAPTLSLKGVYRFGQDYHVSLQIDGEAVFQATWRAGQAPVPAVNGYQIAAVDNTTVTLYLPVGMTCENSTQGGHCIGRNQMALTLAETVPIPAAGGAAESRGNSEEMQRLFEALDSGDDNAGEALREMFRNRGRGGGGFGRGGGGGFGTDQ